MLNGYFYKIWNTVCTFMYFHPYINIIYVIISYIKALSTLTVLENNHKNN